MTISMFLLMIDLFIAHFLPFLLVATNGKHPQTASLLRRHDIDDDGSIVTAFFRKVVVKRGKAEIFAEPVGLDCAFKDALGLGGSLIGQRLIILIVSNDVRMTVDNDRSAIRNQRRDHVGEER